MGLLFKAMVVWLALGSVHSSWAGPPAEEELDAWLDGVQRRKSDVLATNRVGIFRADLEAKAWDKLELPPEMPVGGKFGDVPDGSEQILYFDRKSRQAQSDGKTFGLYGSTDAGRTWKLLSAADDYGLATMLDDGSLYAVRNAAQLNWRAVIEVSRDMGKSWRDITGESFGSVSRLFPDPDHPGLICLSVNSIRGYILQAEDESYRWKPTREWEWHPELRKDISFARGYSTSAGGNPLYTLRATLRNYFEHDFSHSLTEGFVNGVQLPAIDLRADQERFEFQQGERIVVPIRVQFLEDLRAREWYRKNVRKGGEGAAPAPVVERLLDSQAKLSLWGLRIEFRGQRVARTPLHRLFQLTKSGQFDGNIELLRRLKEAEELAKRPEPNGATESEWKVVEFSAASPYRRTLTLDRLHEFKEPGEYRVQIDYDSDNFANRERGEWVGRFSSAVFTIVIQAGQKAKVEKSKE